MTVLLDANVLIALTITDHVHHGAAEEWFGATDTGFATCPITEGALVRLLIRDGRDAGEAHAALHGLHSSRRHEFWSDDIAYTEVRLTGVVGHRQVTDAYLAQLARAHDARLATFDRGLAAQHADVADLVPVG
ncbi:TA system VapC family ribonuclease toxin [Pseudonocardia nematodicida]|uniref:Ribonuclease VapC n=1 Tax=Pseudonocardia nematodicida TaxID=1206997 RepID=A0ABV1KDF3_9PSEU